MARKPDVVVTQETIYYTVVFDPNNATSTFSRAVEQPEYTVKNMPPEPLPAQGEPNPTLFEGWFIDGDAEQRFTAMTPVTQDMTVQASWNREPTTHIVTFDSNGAHRPAVPRQKAAENNGDSLTFLPEEPRRDGYIFVGWLVVQCDSGIVGYYLDPYTPIRGHKSMPSGGRFPPWKG